MSGEKIIKQKITEEINLIPESNRHELYELIHNFRTNLKPKKSQKDSIMEFAGSWLDISEDDFYNLCEEIEQRRQASSRRFEF